MFYQFPFPERIPRLVLKNHWKDMEGYVQKRNFDSSDK